MGTLIAILLIYSIYYIFSVNKYDKHGHFREKNKKKDDNKKNKKLSKEEIKRMKQLDYDKLPSEAKIFVNMNKIDLDKINIRGLLKMIGLLLGLCIGFGIIIAVGLSSVLFHGENIIFEILVGFVLAMIFYIIGTKVLSNKLKKEGVTKDE